MITFDCNICSIFIGKLMINTFRIGKLKSLYLFQNQSNSWSKWGFDTFLRRPLSSVLSKLYSPSNSFISDTTETFVILDQVKV